MLKIAVITPGNLPVPAFDGGAVESLVQMLIDENELSRNVHFLIFTIQDQNKKVFNLNYELTTFKIINDQALSYKLFKFIRYLINSIGFIRIKNQFISSVFKFSFLLEECDIILLENDIKHLKFFQNLSSKVVLHLHNNYLNELNAKSLEAHILSLSKIICVSDFLKRDIQNIFPSCQKIVRVHNGFRDSKYSEQKKSLNRSSIDIPNNAIVIVFCGRVQKSKGIWELVRVFNRLCSEQKNLKLLIIGPEDYNSTKMNEANLIIQNFPHLSDNLIFTGFIDQSRVHSYLSLCDIGVVPSIADEAFGMISIEAQAAGLPVVISDSGGLTETVSDKSSFIASRGPEFENELFFYLNLNYIQYHNVYLLCLFFHNELIP